MIGPISNSYWVEPGRLLAGEYPGDHQNTQGMRSRIDAFLEAGINCFVDLTHSHELPPYEFILEELADTRGIDAVYRRFPIRDHDIPPHETMKAILDHVDASLNAGRNIYIHCWGGIGRTGTTVGCYLVRRGRSGEQALDQLAELWTGVPKRRFFPRSPETDLQVDFVLHWNEPLETGSANKQGC